MLEAQSEYRWRETYFVWFRSSRRPALEQLVSTIRQLDGKYELTHGEADEKGLVESLTVSSLDDNSALEIDYAHGDEVLIEAHRMTDELRQGDGERGKLAELPHCDARFEVMHFERYFDGETQEESDEMFDPKALVIVLEALITLTDGVGVDPQAGWLL